MANIRQKSVADGSRWSLMGYGAEAIIRLSSNLILVRLLAPEMFGLMALVGVVLVAFTLLSDVGLQPSVVRSKRGDDKAFLSTVWTVQVVRGFLLFVLISASAGIIANFFEQPELKNLILLIALTPIADGFASVGIHVATRHLDLKPVVILEVLTHAVTFSAVVVLAAIRGDVWALAIGSVIARITRAFLSHVLFRQDHVAFGLDKSALLELISFGKWILLATALTFTSSQIDKIMLGKYVSLAEVGIYTILIAWAEIPRVAMMKWASQVFYPQISRWYSNLETFRKKTQNLRGTILSIAALPMAFAIGFSAPWISFFYPEPYASWGHLLSIMFVGIWIECLDILYHQGFLTVNRPQVRSVGMTVSTIVFMLLMLPAYTMYGLVGVAWLTVFCRFCRLAIQWFFARQESLLFIRQDIIHSIMVAIVAIAVMFTIKISSTVVSELAALFTITAAGIVIAILWLRMYWPKLANSDSASS